MHQKTTQKKVLTLLKQLKWILLAVSIIVVSYVIYLKSTPIAYVSRAQKATAQDVVFGHVTIRELHRVKIRNQRSGIVKESFVDIGKVVKKGDLLMELDAEEYQIDYDHLLKEQEIKKELISLPKQSEYQYVIAEEEHTRLKELEEMGSVTQKEMIISQRDLQLKKDNIEREKILEEKSIQLREIDIRGIEYDLEHMSIRSPVNGVIVNTFVQKGDLVNQSQILFEINGYQIEIVAEISQEDFDRVKKGLPAIVLFKGYPAKEFKARVHDLVPMADSEREKFEVYLKLDDSSDKFIPGLTGEVRIIVDERDNSIIVPTQAVWNNKVLINEGRKIKEVEVKQGFRNMLTTEILEGVNEGDLVVTEHNNLLQDNQTIRKRFE